MINVGRQKRSIRTSLLRLVILSLLFWVTQAHSIEDEVLGGHMTCEIVSQNITEIVDGIPTEVTHNDETFKIGEFIDFKYEASYFGINIFLGRDGKPGILELQPWYDDIISSNPNFFRLNLNFVIDGLMTFGKQRIAVGGRDTIGTTTILHLFRYHKSDWEGMFIRYRMPKLRTHVFTIDCRHVSDKVDDIVAKIAAM